MTLDYTREDFASPAFRSAFFKAVEGVQAGAKFLDRKIKNWFKKIDQDRFNISSGHDCILAQLVTPTVKWIEKNPGLTRYAYATEKLFSKKTKSGDSRFYGFLPSGSPNGKPLAFMVEALWKHEIDKRLALKPKRKRKAK